MWATFYGGSDDDYGSGVIADAVGNVIITGYTQSSNFPVTPGAFQTINNGFSLSAGWGGDAFIVKLNSSGNRVWATYYGGNRNEEATSVTSDGAGDIIFTAEFGSSSLSFLEARIWVHQSSLSVTPVAFSWGGSFDGATSGATYGYANIAPKTAGTFYTGLQCVNNTWAGPFSVVLQDNSVVANYNAKQFMEFSVCLLYTSPSPRD